MTRILFDFIICSLATFFFAILFKIPRKAIIESSLLGGLGYAVYDICSIYIDLLPGYFFGTFTICIFAEILARVKKMPALIFIIPAVIPLVPGVGLYQTMRLFVENDSVGGVSKCIETLSCAGVMAVAIAIMPMFIRAFENRKKAKNSKMKI